MGEYNALDVAKFVVNECREAKKPVDNLKLQKILYFLWIDYYKLTGKKLFEDRIEAWKYGPVIVTVYRKYRSCVAEPILFEEESSLSDDDKAILKPLIEKYNGWTVSKLVRDTHEKNGPWDINYEEGKSFREISYSDIVDYACKS